jgi:hypothetical protein
MAEHERRNQKAVLLVGPGPRPRETAAVLAVLSALDAAGERRAEPLQELGLADLEELLTQRSPEGLLILEAGRVPGEDIGFVRRFLERRALWRLVVVGEDEQDPHARALLALGRAEWLAWPPDLARLRALLPASKPGRVEAERSMHPRGRRAPRGGPAPLEGEVDLGDLLEELLAGAALRGEGQARYHFSRGRGGRVPGGRAALRAGLQGLVELARVCAGSDGLVRANLGGSGEAVEVQLEFPRAMLPEKGLPGLFTGAVEHVDPLLAESLAEARESAELLAESGARVELVSVEPGRVGCAVHFAARPAELATVRPGKPEDPFA